MERRTVYALAAIGGAVALSALLFGRAPQAAASAPRVPTDPNEVVETLPFGSGAADPKSREAAALRTVLARDPKNLAVAARLAQLDIELSRERSDPRYLGHAQAALAPWWTMEDAPVEVLVLRATIEQSLHDFDAALRDLDRAVAVRPNHPQAWVTRAVVLTVRGRYEEARASCEKLVPLTSLLVVTVCQTGIDSVTGKAGPAYERLEAVLAQGGRISEDEEAWARSSLGEYAQRAGKLDEAQKHFERTLQIDADDAYVRAALVDLLIDRGKLDEAIALVRGREVNDGHLLRLAIAEKRAGAKDAQAHIAMLAARFEASRQRGDVVHRREEARFRLELEGDARRALDLAKANWDVQKEPWDVRVFLEAARAAKAPAEAKPIADWLETTKLEDPFIRKVAAELFGGKP